jgi:hypothetical protein
MEATMRTALMMVTICCSLAVSSVCASAQVLDAAASPCWPMNVKGQVIVTKADRSTVKDTLLCMSGDEIRLASAGTVPLDSVLRIEKPRDGVLDGVLKGAAAGLVALALCAPECGGAEPILRITVAYGILGGVIDAAQGNSTTIYRKRPAPSLAWKIRF